MLPKSLLRLLTLLLLPACTDSPAMLPAQYCSYCTAYDGGPMKAPCRMTTNGSQTICCCNRIDGGESCSVVTQDSPYCDVQDRTPQYLMRDCLTWDGEVCACTPEMSDRPDCRGGPATCQNDYDRLSATQTQTLEDADWWCRDFFRSDP